MPKVTIAIPTRNRIGYLRLALDSALRQTLDDIEIVISDNRCTDGTAEMLETVTDPRIRVLHQQQDLSMVENWNSCVAAATGTYFLLLSDDDVLEPRAVEAMVEAFEAGPESGRTGFVYGGGLVVDAEGETVRKGKIAPAQEEAADLILAFFNGERDTWPCSILLRRSDLGTGYSADFRVMTDAGMWIEAVCRHGRARFVDEHLVNYRVHASLTGATPIAVWQRENSTSAALAIRCLAAAGRLTPSLQRQIEQAVYRLNLHVALALPHGAKDRRRRTILRKYLQHLPQFASWYGMSHWIRAMAHVLLPPGLVRFVQTVRGTTPETHSQS